MSSTRETTDYHGEDRDLAWLAFRYVAGELGETQAAVFERRLGEDQVARESVAEAVLIAGAVSRVAGSVRRDSRNRKRVLIAAAVTVLLASTLIVSQRTSPLASEKALALAWSGIAADTEEFVGESDSLDDSPPPELSQGESSDGPPAWLVEAAALPVLSAPHEGQGS